MSYSQEVGARLRGVRRQRGWSLQEVERRSAGEWKAAVVGSYERGDRNISASRLLELASFYGVSAAEVLPPDDRPRPPTHAGSLVLDLDRLDSAGVRYEGVRRYCESILVQRGDHNRLVLSLRSEDVRALGALLDIEPDDLEGELQEAGVLRRD